MAAPHENQGHNIVNGLNGHCNGGDEFPEQPQPSTSGGALVPQRPEPNLRSVCFRGLLLCQKLLRSLARTFSSLRLQHETLDAIYCTLTAAGRATTAAWEETAAPELQSRRWYVMLPIAMLLMITRIGIKLSMTYLDMGRPVCQNLVDGLQDFYATVEDLKRDACNTLDSDKTLKQLPELEPALDGMEFPVLSPSSSVSTLSTLSETEEEPAQLETTGDKSMYFSVEQLEVVGAEAGEDEFDKTEKAEEKVQGAEVEEERLAKAAEQPDRAAEVTDDPRPQPEPPQPQPEAVALASAEDAERAAMSATRKRPAQAASSQDFLAAEGPSPTKRDTRKHARRPTKRSSKGTLLLSLFGTKVF